MKGFNVTLRSKRNIINNVFLATLLTLFISDAANAAGVSLTGTRIIYPQGESEVKVSSSNSDKKESFLVQSWVSDEHGNKSSSFIVTPPLFVLKPGGMNVLQIMYTGPALPEDKETVFYFNNKAIPSMEKAPRGGNMLQIATQSVIKLFYRPVHLTVKPTDAPAMLRCQASGNSLTISNPSPYYTTLVNFMAGGQKLPNTMIPPMGSQTVKAQSVIKGAISYQTLNDYGATTPELTCKV